jgi:hypothetical protein
VVGYALPLRRSGDIIEEANEETQVNPVDEDKLIEKLRLIETLFAGAATPGEKVAAERAKQRILERLKFWEQEDPPVEYRFTMGDMWSRKVFVALLRRYGITPYRYSGQRYTTVMARVSRRFVSETLWPEFQAVSETLETYLSEVTDRVVSQVIHQDSSEAEVVEKPKHLPEAGATSTKSSVPLSQSGRGETMGHEGGVAGPSRKRSRRKGKKHKKRKRG